MPLQKLTRQNVRCKAPTEHSIYENSRVNTFSDLLKGNLDNESLIDLGELMLQSHASYTACGLSEPRTDRIVELVRENTANGVFGARITGGGSGGTVAILARRNSGETISKIAKEFGETGQKNNVFAARRPMHLRQFEAAFAERQAQQLKLAERGLRIFL